MIGFDISGKLQGCNSIFNWQDEEQHVCVGSRLSHAKHNILRVQSTYFVAKGTLVEQKNVDI